MGKWTRRAILTTGVVGGGALVVGVAIRPGNENSTLGPFVLEDGEQLINSWVKIDQDNVVTAIVPHSEMGQGAQTALAQMLADELDADWEKVEFVEAPAEDGYANYAMGKGFILGDAKIPSILVGTVDGLFQQIVKTMHLQTTGGSASVRATGVYGMRVAGAAAREMLLEAAAEKWSVAVSDLQTDKSFVVSPSGERLSYAELASAAGKKTPSATPKLKPIDEFQLMGKSVPRRDIPSKVDGSAKFGVDAEIPGMKYATVKAAPVFGATVKNFDADQALAMPGVHKVVNLDTAIAVVADGYWQAKQAVAAIPVEWSATENDGVDSEKIVAQFRRDIDTQELTADRDTGNASATLSGAAQQIEREYWVPYLAHACMEPMNATANVENGRCQMIVACQDPLRCKHEVADALGFDADAVSVTNLFMGGGFGRKARADVSVQAARIAADAGVPIKLIWSREEDIQHDIYRPAVVSKFRAGIDDAGKVSVWENRYVDKHEPIEAPLIPYAIGEQLIGHVSSPTHIPFGPWRSVDHSQHGFFTESFIDELAYEVGQDPYEFRRQLLANNPRLTKVLDVAAEKGGWGRPLSEGQGLGISLQESFGSIVAQVVDATVTGNDVKVNKVTVAVDPGFAVSPDGVTAQMESGVIYGLTAALHGDINIANGRVVESNFDSYPMLRMKDAPDIETHIITSDNAWGGAGEPGTPGIAPALTAAIYAATGTRVRRLPVSRYDFSARVEEEA